jgi:hypothetical protein
MRCVQCGWTVSFEELDDVTRRTPIGDSAWQAVVPLHKGGCKRKPRTKKGQG